jgi:hypothetical protein
MTYGFKSDGRRRDPQPLEPKGKDLLPGAYSVDDFVERYTKILLRFSNIIFKDICRMNRLRSTYGFKGPQRQEVLQKCISANHDKVLI